MTRLALREAWARKRRLAGSFIAVFLGVAFLTGTLVLADTLGASIDRYFTQAYTGTDVVVRNGTSVSDSTRTQRGMIDGAAADRVRQVPGVAVAEPVVQGTGQLVAKDGKVVQTRGPRQAGNWIPDKELNAYRIVEGREPRASGEVVINRGSARDGDLRVGDRTTVLMPQPVAVTVVGISKFGNDDGFGGASFAAFTLADAQRYLAKTPGQVSSVYVKGADGVSADALAARVRTVLPAGTEATTGQRLADESMTEVNEGFVNAFRIGLTAFAAVALLVAAFSIHNTFSIQVAQRTRESALLRALGARRGQVILLVVIEALVVGAAATVAGLAGGLGVAALLKALFSGFGLGLPAQGLVFTATTPLIAVPVGIVVTTLAALSPVLRASRVTPLAALRESGGGRVAPAESRGLIGAALGVVAVGAVVWGALTDATSVAVAGAVMSLVVMIVLAPVAAGPVSSLLGRWNRRGVSAALARQNAMRNPRRTAGAATSLMIGVGVVTLLTVFVGSLRASMEDDVAGSLRGDLIVNSGDRFGGGFGFTPGLADEVARLPEVGAAAGLARAEVRIGTESKTVRIGDPAKLSRVLHLDVKSGALPADQAATGSGIAVSAKVADDRGWKVGDSVPMTFADGARENLPIAAVYRGADLVGDYLLTRTTWAAHTRETPDGAIFVALRDGVGAAAGKAAVGQATKAQGAPDVQDRDEYVASQTEQMNSFLGVVYVMLALAILIALLGIANTLALSVHERTRELGLLRAVGATRRQIRSIVRGESVIVALFGTAGGVGLGVFLGWSLSRSALDAFAAQPVQLMVIALVGAAAGVLAAVRPARRAAKLNALTAISTD